MFWTDSKKPMTRKEVKTNVVIVIACAVYIAAALMMADKPAHQSDCVADTVTCSQEVGQ